MSQQTKEYVLHTGLNVFNTCTEAFTQTDMIVVAASCTLISLFFILLERSVPSKKGKSWLVMLFCSTILSVFGCRAYYITEDNNSWDLAHVYGEDFISRCVVLFFVSSNLMDLSLGSFYYPDQLDPLTTIFHHFFYVTFIAILLAHNYSRGFLLCFVMEIPTALLALGSVWQEYRTDIGFGVSFFITRLVYNAYLAYQLYCLSPQGIIWRVCIAVLCMHLYWFYKWVKAYGSKIYTANTKT